MVALLAVLLAAFPAHAESADTEQLARWQLNNADLLVDEGKYMQAVEYIDSAYEMSSHAKTRADALMARAMVLATFLDSYAEAIATYDRLAREFPQHAEFAAYQSAFILHQAGETDRAKQAYRNYLQRYPQGRFSLQAEAMLETLREPEPGPVPDTVQPGGVQPILRVAMARKARSLSLKGSGSQLCANGLGCASQLSISPSGRGLLVNGRQVDSAALTFESQSPIAVTIGSKNKRVHGAVQVRNMEGRLLVLNLVRMEDYLLSVVPSESYGSWPLETLKAQAVAARTYAWYQKLHRQGRDYDMMDDTRDQMYGGVDREMARATKAVQETAGVVLTWNGKPILAQYTANSGGQSADAGAVFNTPKPYLVSHADPASLAGQMASWNKRYTTDEVVAALRNIGINASGLRAIEPAERGPSGRIIKVRLVHSGGSTVVRTRTTLASSRALKLPEVLMDIVKSGNSYVFNGRGHGHGVGYSQWGGAELGKTQTYDAILTFYYPKTTLERAWK